MVIKVLKKELLDLFRDYRSIILLLIPLILFPLMIGIYNWQLLHSEEEERSVFPVAVLGEKNPLFNTIEEQLKYDGIELEVIPTDHPEKQLVKGEVMLILDFSDSFQIIYNQNSVNSTRALSALLLYLETDKYVEFSGILEEHNIETTVLDKYNYTCIDISEYSDSTSNNVLATIAPLLLVMIILSNGSGIATDTFAGEKERGSLEGILITQVSRPTLYAAKSTAILLYTLLSSGISILSYVLSFKMFPKVAKMFGINSDITPIQLIEIITLMLMFAWLCTALLSLMSVTASSVRESQTRLGIITIIPSIIGLFIVGMELSNFSIWLYSIPFLNVILCIKEVLLSTVTVEKFAVYAFSTIIASVLLQWIGLHRIKAEKVLY